jgi:hypothetical protein
MWFQKPVKEEAPQNIFHGVDLNEWNYLGSSPIKYGTQPFEVYYFMKKGDDVRKYVVKGSDKSSIKFVSENHRYISHTCELWRISELEIYTPIYAPSNWLKDHLFQTNGWKWDTTKKWWVLATDQDKYEYAQANQSIKVIATDDNIVSVNFKKE